MPEIVVAAQVRSDLGKNANNRTRAEGWLPGTLYGAGKPPQTIRVKPKEISAILRSATGENTLFELEYSGTRRKVILKDFQVDPVKGGLLHADFYEVALDKAIEVQVHIEIVGTPVGVKLQGGVLDFVTRELEVECLPTNIPEKIVVDVSDLELGKHIRVSDLLIPPNVQLLTPTDVVVVHVVAPREEEEVAAPAEAAAVEGVVEPEVIRKGKAVAEGEAAPEEKPEKAEKPEKPEKKDKK